MRQLMYSRVKNDRRTFGRYIYKPHFLDIIASRCDITEAKRRVRISQDGKYKYTPSKEYMDFHEKHGIKQFRRLPRR